VKKVSLVATAIALTPAAALAQTALYEVQSFPAAFAVFDEYCVQPLPSADRFLTALRGSSLGWQRVEKRERVPRLDPPNYFQSRAGELSYVRADNLPEFIGSPTCHFEFKTDSAYQHDEAARLLAAQLNLGEGKREGNRRAPQTKWETRTVDGMTIRVFLSSNVEVADASGARLSITRLRDRD
jgi:hypothetical protein